MVSAVAWTVRSGTTVRTFGLWSNAAAALAEPLKAKPWRAWPYTWLTWPPAALARPGASFAGWAPGLRVTIHLSGTVAPGPSVGGAMLSRGLAAVAGAGGSARTTATR